MLPLSRVLLIGQTECGEFRAAGAQLEEAAEVTRVHNMDAALRAVDDATPWDLIILAERWPGEFSHAAVERLRRAAPLAPLVGLLGSWCEGEVRSGQPWPGVTRVYWHQWPAACRRELARLREGRRSVWTLPATATDEERVMARAQARPNASAGLVVVSTASHAMVEWLAPALRRRGWAVAWLRPGEPVRVEGAAAGVFDTAEMDALAADELRRFHRGLGPVPIVALLDFPRLEDHDRALGAGAATVLSKPLSLEDLDDELDRLVGATTEKP